MHSLEIVLAILLAITLTEVSSTYAVEKKVPNVTPGTLSPGKKPTIKALTVTECQALGGKVWTDTSGLCKKTGKYCGVNTTDGYKTSCITETE